jgi:phosphoribosylaminoimidazolecarboxamide formyltransferase/IMP cyclohydrolase
MLFARASPQKAFAAHRELRCGGVDVVRRSDRRRPAERPLLPKDRERLRYGENPHQSAALYLTSAATPNVATARQVQGKELSYNNINDADAAFELVSDLTPEQPAVVIVKHANPCGAAAGVDLVEAYEKALRCDRCRRTAASSRSNAPLDAQAAQAITGIFTEVVVAPEAMTRPSPCSAGKQTCAAHRRARRPRVQGRSG